MKSTIEKNAEVLIPLSVLFLLIGIVWVLFADTLIVGVAVTAIGGAILGLVGTVQAELLDDALTLTMESDTLKAV